MPLGSRHPQDEGFPPTGIPEDLYNLRHAPDHTARIGVRVLRQ